MRNDAHYLKVAQAFDEALRSQLDYTTCSPPQRHQDLLARWLLPHLSQSPDGALAEVLEVGCGNGRLLCHLIRTAPVPVRVTGSDVSRELLTKAQQCLLECSSTGQFRLVYGNVLSLPADELGGPFDLIYLWDVLQHLKATDHGAVIRLLARCLRPNGTLVVIDKERLSLYGLRATLRRALGLVPPYYMTARYPSFRSLRHAAEAAGLTRPNGHAVERNREYRALTLRRPSRSSQSAEPVLPIRERTVAAAPSATEIAREVSWLHPARLRQWYALWRLHRSAAPSGHSVPGTWATMPMLVAAGRARVVVVHDALGMCGCAVLLDLDLPAQTPLPAGSRDGVPGARAPWRLLATAMASMVHSPRNRGERTCLLALVTVRPGAPAAEVEALLIEEAAARARQDGYTQVRIHLGHDESERARRLYAAGFVPVGEEDSMGNRRALALRTG